MSEWRDEGGTFVKSPRKYPRRNVEWKDETDRKVKAEPRAHSQLGLVR